MNFPSAKPASRIFKGYIRSRDHLWIWWHLFHIELTNWSCASRDFVTVHGCWSCCSGYLCSVEFLNTGKFSLLLLLVLVGYIWLSGNNNYILYGLVFFFCKHECLTNTYTDCINKHYFSYLKYSLQSLLWNELFILDTYFYDAQIFMVLNDA